MAVAAFGLFIVAAGIWAVVSTLELEVRGLAHTFSRAPGAFSASVAPEAAQLSYWIHLGLGCLLVIVGCVLLVLPFTTSGHRLRFPHGEGPSWSGRGVLRLLGWFVVTFIFIGIWKSFFG